MRLPAILFAFAIAMAAPATAQDYPKMKAGQWDTTTTTSRNPNAPATKTTVCTDDATQKQMMDVGKGMQREMCSKSEFRREGGSYIGDSVCQFGESKMTSHSVMTVQGDSSYKTVVNTKYDPPLMGMKDSTTTIDAKYAGPCRDGLQPGDVVLPNGQKMNMKNLPSRPAGPPPAKAQ